MTNTNITLSLPTGYLDDAATIAKSKHISVEDYLRSIILTSSSPILKPAFYTFDIDKITHRGMLTERYSTDTVLAIQPGVRVDLYDIIIDIDSNETLDPRKITITSVYKYNNDTPSVPYATTNFYLSVASPKSSPILEVDVITKQNQKRIGRLSVDTTSGSTRVTEYSPYFAGLAISCKR